jgi:hypothetical protein
MRFLAASPALRTNGNVHEIAKDISVSDTAVRNWLGYSRSPSVSSSYLHPYSGNTLSVL